MSQLDLFGEPKPEKPVVTPLNPLVPTVRGWMPDGAEWATEAEARWNAKGGATNHVAATLSLRQMHWWHLYTRYLMCRLLGAEPSFEIVRTRDTELIHWTSQGLTHTVRYRSREWPNGFQYFDGIKGKIEQRFIADIAWLVVNWSNAEAPEWVPPFSGVEPANLRVAGWCTREWFYANCQDGKLQDNPVVKVEQDQLRPLYEYMRETEQAV